MFDSIKNNLVFPLLTRLGSLGSGFLVAAGMHQQAAEQVVLGAIALSLFGVDLLASYLNRKREKK